MLYTNCIQVRKRAHFTIGACVREINLLGESMSRERDVSSYHSPNFLTFSWCMYHSAPRAHPIQQFQTYVLIAVLSSLMVVLGPGIQLEIIRELFSLNHFDNKRSLQMHVFLCWNHFDVRDTNDFDQKSIFDHDRLIGLQKLIFRSDHRFSILRRVYIGTRTRMRHAKTMHTFMWVNL